jgi:hypothetical protein
MEQGRIVDISSARAARRFADYSITVHADRLPAGVELWRWVFTGGKLVKQGANR